LGHVLIESDSSQIEARILAWFAGQDDLVEDFTQKRDVYKKMASHIYNVDPEEVDKQQRDVGKETILGCGFQMGGNRFHAQLKMRGISMELEKAAHTVQVYRETYSKIPELWELMGEALVAIMKGQTYKLPNDCLEIVKGGMRLPSGLVIRYDDLRYEKNPDTGKREMVYTQGRKRTKIYSGKATENMVQGLARCVVAEQALLVAKRYKWALTVHDSLVVVAREAEAEEAMAYTTECMRYVPTWAEGLPLDCEAGYGRSYGEC